MGGPGPLPISFVVLAASGPEELGGLRPAARRAAGAGTDDELRSVLFEVNQFGVPWEDPAGGTGLGVSCFVCLLSAVCALVAVCRGAPHRTQQSFFQRKRCARAPAFRSRIRRRGLLK